MNTYGQSESRFLDGDGVMNELIHYREPGILDSSSTTKAEFRLIPSVGGAINRLHNMGYSVEWQERWEYKSEASAGSSRSVDDVLSAASARADVITIPPQFLDRMADHNHTREEVRQFVADAQKAMEMMEKARS